MAYNFRFPMGTNPQDPRKKRLPIPEQYPYEPEVLEAPEELPELPVREFQAPAIPLTPGPNRPQGPGTLTPAPFRTLGQFGQWYTGQPTDILPGDVLPPSPEWGKRTPSYSRLNPPPPRMGASLPGQRPGVIARQPSAAQAPAAVSLPGQERFTPQEIATAATQPRFFDVARQQLAEARRARSSRSQMGASLPGQKPGVMGNQPVNTPSPLAPLPLGQQQQFTLPETRRRQAIAAQRGATPSEQARQFLTEPGLQGAIDYRPGTDTWGDIGKELKAGGLNFVSSLLPTQAEREQNERMMSLGGRPSVALKPLVTQEGLDRQSEALLASRSSVALGRQAAMERAKQAAGGDFTQEIANFFAAIAEDPRRAEQSVVTNLPQLLPTVGLATLSKVAALAKTTKAMQLSQALARGTTTFGAVSTAADAQKSAYDNIRQSLIAQGIPEKDANLQAMQKSMPAALIGAGLGAIGARTGLEETILKGGAKGLVQRSLRVGKEFGTEVAEEALPLMATNYQMGQPILKDVGSTIAETLVATSPFAGLAGMGGGAKKVPDELQKQLYDNMVQAGMPRAPLSYVPGVPSQRQEPESEMTGAIPPDRVQAYRDLRERQRAAGVSPFGVQRPAGEAVPPVQPPPLAPNAGGQAAPFTPSGTLFTPGWSLRPLDEQFQERTARGALYGLVGPEQRATSEAAMEVASAEGQPATLRDVTSTATNKNRYGQGEYGKIAQSANKAPSFSFEKLKKAYGLPKDANRLELFEPIMQNLAAELGDVIGRDISINDVHRLAYIIDESKSPADEQNVWGKWYKKYGRAYGLTEQDVWNLQDIAAGGGRGSFFDDYAVQQTLLGEPTSKGQNKDIQQIVREDMAELLGYDVNDPKMKQFSQASISPDMWRLWARSRGFGDQKRYPGVMQKLEMMIEEGELRKTAKKTEKADDTAKIPRKGQWPGTTPTTGATPPPPSPAAPTAPQAPTRPAAPLTPVPLSTTPTRYQPSSLKRQYGEMVQEGVPRAPRSYVPGVPLQRQGPGYQITGQGRGITSGRPQGPAPQKYLPSRGEESTEAQRARETRESLKSRSPFAKARQQERAQAEAATQQRRPPTPPESAASPVAPTPPVAPPAPSGATQPAPITPPRSPRQRLVDADWTIESSQRFTGPDGSTIEREDGSRGKKAGWVHTDAAGNRTNYNTAQQAIEAVLAEPSTAAQPEVKAQPTAKRAKAQPEAKSTPPSPAAPKQRKSKAAKEAPPAQVEPTPTKAPLTPKVEPVADENKALFNEVDAATKPKDRKRIEADYGAKGKKAIFVENNINEILKEAEETGKVTKQCP